MHEAFNIDGRILDLSGIALERAKESFERIERVTEYNQQKVLAAFIKNRISEPHLHGTTGYGYGDIGREAADRVAADCFGSEDALIRYAFTCGTHALTVALFALLRPGDTMLCITGRPYDTICPVIGMDGRGKNGSLADFGINYEQLNLTPDGEIDLDALRSALRSKRYALVYIQRSRGYTLRPSLGSEQIGAAAAIAHEESDCVVAVDNCYGEFAEETEPCQCGADIIIGSLIKNPGGAVARCGGYMAGKKELIELCAMRMTTPSLGREVGASLDSNRDILMGLFNAPHVVGEAMKTAVFASALFELMGFEATPRPSERRHDIIQALKLKNSENLIAFCRGLQSGSPIDSFVTPEPWDMPGYPCKVIMAAGAFTSGSSIELSADAPLREPYAVWMQGGVNFHSAKLGIMFAAQEVLKINGG